MGRRARCTKCGFLGWDVTGPDGMTPIGWWECRVYWRERLPSSPERGQTVEPDTDYTVTVGCRRNQWIFTAHATSDDAMLKYLRAEDLDQRRKCPYSTRYQPGYGPEEHKELKREGDMRKTAIWSTLGGAAVGAAAAIIAGLLT